MNFTLELSVVCYTGTVAHKCCASMNEYLSKIVVIGETTVLGAGVGMALLGVAEIAAAITLNPWCIAVRHYGDCLFLFGGIMGAIVGWSRPNGCRAAEAVPGAGARIQEPISEKKGAPIAAAVGRPTSLRSDHHKDHLTAAAARSGV